MTALVGAWTSSAWQHFDSKLHSDGRSSEETRRYNLTFIIAGRLAYYFPVAAKLNKWCNLSFVLRVLCQYFTKFHPHNKDCLKYLQQSSHFMCVYVCLYSTSVYALQWQNPRIVEKWANKNAYITTTDDSDGQFCFLSMTTIISVH